MSKSPAWKDSNIAIKCVEGGKVRKLSDCSFCHQQEAERERTRSRVRETMNPQSSIPPHPYDILSLAKLCFINLPSIITNY